MSEPEKLERGVAAPDRYLPAANPRHTILVVAVLGLSAFLGTILANYMKAGGNSHRIRFYVLALLIEWLWFILVVADVWHSGAPVRIVLGDRWNSIRQVLRDVGIALAFWIVSIALLLPAAWLLRVASQGRKLDFMLPHGATELTLWIALAVTAGVSEETVFRGYLQRQFMALTKSAPAGILLSAALFGACHMYQGTRRAILMGIYGAMFGILAYWRRSVRPGMIAHAWHDSLAGVLATLVRR